MRRLRKLAARKVIAHAAQHTFRELDLFGYTPPADKALPDLGTIHDAVKKDLFVTGWTLNTGGKTGATQLAAGLKAAAEAQQLRGHAGIGPGTEEKIAAALARPKATEGPRRSLLGTTLPKLRAVVGLSTPTDVEPRKDGKGFGDALMGGRGADVFSRDVAVMRDASPVRHVSKSLPPVLLVVGVFESQTVGRLASNSLLSSCLASGAIGAVQVTVILLVSWLLFGVGVPGAPAPTVELDAFLDRYLTAMGPFVFRNMLTNSAQAKAVAE